ncbi:MAG: helix-turn-helix domain-containing protein [Streptomyces sp.]|nr:helix-turn-helix domain-containing protein [Streptomyces sp.]
MATRDLERLAKRVKAHRLELYPSRLAAARAAGISKDTWQRVEEGLEVREGTYAAIDKALGWATGSCMVIADGYEPVLADDAGAPAGAASAAPGTLGVEELRRAAFEAARKTMPGAPIGDIDSFSDELVEVLRRTGRVKDGD